MEYTLPTGFMERMERLLGEITPAFLAGYAKPLKRGLRVNTLKCSVDHFLNCSPMELTPSPFIPHGFVLEGELRAGADPLHHAGAYYMQEPSATSAVTVLDPKPGERVLDLCAAPGGKSTQIAAALEGQGLLWSNEYVRSRALILAQNLERCGVRNAVVSNTDPSTLCEGLEGYFHAVLVDAPCSGEGMFRKEPAALEHWSEDNIRLCAHRQEEILRAGAQAVAAGGRLVYSTCTFAPEENECMIARFLMEHPDFELIDAGVHFGRPGFTPERVASFVDAHTMDMGGESPTSSKSNLDDFLSLPLERSRRILPDDGGEGHFVALLHRRSENSGGYNSHRIATFDTSSVDTNSILFNNLYSQCFISPLKGTPYTIGGLVRLLPEDLPALKGLGVLFAGVAAAEICKNRLEPCHALFMATGTVDNCASTIDLQLNDPRLTAFLHGETIEAPDLRGWTAVAVEGIVTGFGKASGDILKNRYPKGLRLLG